MMPIPESPNSVDQSVENGATGGAQNDVPTGVTQPDPPLLPPSLCSTPPDDWMEV
jgi:hypothetical protein